MFFDPAMIDAWPLTGTLTSRGLKLLRDAPTPDTHEAVVRDHLRLFGGAGKSLACPYESPWVDRDGLVFDISTFDVRDAYAEYGLRVTAYNREPDDHVGYELAFVAHLARMIAENPRADTVELTKVITRFTSHHLAAFTPQLREAMTAHADTVFYRAMAELLGGFVATARTFTA